MLVVDDEPTISEVVSRYLERAGYSTRIARDGPGALAAVADEPPDLVVLDLMLPGIDGLEVMRRLPEHDCERKPIILLTAKGEPTDRVIGLRLGADDYVVKPFSPAELVARVDAVLRQVQTAPEIEDPIEFEDLRIEPAARRVEVNGEEASLTVREYDLLLFLARHPGQVFSRDQLMDAVWQYSFYTDTSTVTVHIRRLRAKIEESPSEPRRLQTVWGVGYRSSRERAAKHPCARGGRAVRNGRGAPGRRSARRRGGSRSRPLAPLRAPQGKRRVALEAVRGSGSASSSGWDSWRWR